MAISDTEALALTYDLVATTMQNHDLDYLLSRLMHRVGGMLDAQAAVVRMARMGELVLVDSTGFQPDSERIRQRISLGKFREQFVPGGILVGIQTGDYTGDLCFEKEKAGKRIEKKNNQQLISVPLIFKNTIHGCYQFLIGTAQPVEKNTRLLLENVAKHVGFLVEQARLDQDNAHLLLVEERTRMANEMHDSLAQTLVGLRMQVRVLDETLHQREEQVVWEELEKLEKQVEQANLELRSLVGRFRAPIQSHEVVEAVDKVISAFRQETRTSVFFQNEWESDALSKEARTDVIRIVQESLANIKKHANANNVRVLLRHQGNRYKIMIEDDGEGFEDIAMIHNRHEDLSWGSPGAHLGQEIMFERATNLGAELKIESEPGEGTRISLEFPGNENITK